MADISITASDVLQSSGTPTTKGIAGEAIAAGETVYQNDDGKLYRADGNDSTKLPVAGIAVNSAPGAGQPFNYAVTDDSLTIGAHGLGNGIPLFQSANPGKICQLADVGTGNLTTCVGVTNSTTKITFGVLGGNGAHA
jgi:Uncharacterized conserved protein (DUF2190)